MCASPRASRSPRRAGDTAAILGAIAALATKVDAGIALLDADMAALREDNRRLEIRRTSLEPNGSNASMGTANDSSSLRALVKAELASSPTWAQVVAGGSSPAPTRNVSPREGNTETASANPRRIRISTFGGQRARRADVENVVNSIAKDANLEGFSFAGGPLGKDFSINFGGEALAAASSAKQFLGSLRGEGTSWVESHVISHRAGEQQIRLYFNPDRTVKQQVADLHWRAFKKAMVQTHEADYLMDARDKVISCKFIPLEQLALHRAKGTFNIVWFQADIDAFLSKEQQGLVVTAYHNIVDAGPSRG
jgi:hypothetical protein